MRMLMRHYSSNGPVCALDCVYNVAFLFAGKDGENRFVSFPGIAYGLEEDAIGAVFEEAILAASHVLIEATIFEVWL